MKRKHRPSRTTTLTSADRDFIHSISLSGEVWTRAKGVSSRYYASNMGRLLTLSWKGARTPAVIRPAKDAAGYLRTVLDGRTIKVHRIIAQTFLEKPATMDTVNHLNGDRDDNRVENLEWCTRLYNTVYHVEEQPKRKGTPKYSQSEIEAIRNYYDKHIAHLPKTGKRRTEAYDALCKMHPQVPRGYLQELCTRRSRYVRGDYTTVLNSPEHHSHTLLDVDIIS